MRTTAAYMARTLGSSGELTGIVQDKIFPIVAEQGTQYPFVTFSMESLSSGCDKTPASGIDEVRETVSCYSPGYAEALDMAEAVRSALEYGVLTEAEDGCGGICRLSGVSESFVSDAFCISLTFEIKKTR